MSDLCVEYHNYSSNESEEDPVVHMQHCLALRQLYDFLDLTPDDYSHPVTVTLNMYIFHKVNQHKEPSDAKQPTYVMCNVMFKTPNIN